jgi:hypothetical protein
MVHPTLWNKKNDGEFVYITPCLIVDTYFATEIWYIFNLWEEKK